jgi:hypothetical protein
LTLIEKGSQSVQKLVTSSQARKPWDHTKLQKQIADVHHAFQVSLSPCFRPFHPGKQRRRTDKALMTQATPSLILETHYFLSNVNFQDSELSL